MAYKMIYLARRAPSVSWENWPKTWKSHAIFASQFPAMEQTIDWMRYTIRVEDPALGDLPVSGKHDGVCVAEAQDVDTFRGKGLTPEQRERIDADELRVFDRYTPEFSFYCNEVKILDGPIGEAAVFRFMKRKADLSREEFARRLHAERAAPCSAATDQHKVLRWALNFTIQAPPPDYPFEAIEECWFANTEDAARALTAPDTIEFSNRVSPLCEAERAITMLTRPTHRWPLGLEA